MKVDKTGAAFTYRRPHAITAEAATTASHQGHGERVLLIDDEAPVLVATAEVLSRVLHRRA